MKDYYWLNDKSRKFLSRGYLDEGVTGEQRVKQMADKAEEILGLKGFSKEFESYAAKGFYSFATPVWVNFGKNKGLGISCYGSYCDDSLDSILNMGRELGMMSKYGGGTSAYLGNIRPRGSSISTGGEADGPTHYAHIYDTIIDKCKQACYKDNVEILTSTGWKLFKNLVEEDLIAEVDEFSKIKFSKPKKIFTYDVDTELINFKDSKNIDISVTDNHKMWFSRRKRISNKRNKNGKFISNEKKFTKLSYSEDANKVPLHRDIFFHRSGVTTEGNFNSLTGFERLQIAFQADGYAIRKKYQFHFSKPRKIKRLESLLEALNIPFKKTLTKDSNTKFTFSLRDKLLYKNFSDWVTLENKSFIWCEQFIEEVSHWDSHITKNDSIVYSSKIESNLDSVQAIASLCRYKSKKTYVEDIYTVYLSRDNNSFGVEKLQTTKEKYKGKVYCVESSTGMVLVRSNGHTLISGNSARRGACAIYLDIEHPDVMEFLDIATDGNDIQKLQTGISIGDEFMHKMIKGDKKARTVWAKVIQTRKEVGYPYLFFRDNVNKNSPYKDIIEAMIVASNLCSEICLPSKIDESFVCCLGSINLLHWNEIKKTRAIECYILFLNAVMEDFIQQADKLPGMGRAVRFAKNHRALGLGVLGYHSYLQSNMIPFESLAAKQFNHDVFSTLQERSLAGSYDANLLGFTNSHFPDRANTTVNAIAPTKSSSFILGQVSLGIEPVTSNYFVKDTAKVSDVYKNPYLLEHLINLDMNTPEIWKSILDHNGSVQHLDIPNKEVFKSFIEISPAEIILQAAQRQKFIDQSQSLNLSIHDEIPIKDVNKLYISAWEQGVKTLYYQIGESSAQNFSREINSCVSCEA